MSTQPHQGDTNLETGDSPTIDDSTNADSQPDSNEAGNDENDPYEKYSDAHGTIRDDGSPLVDGQLYPSSVEEHMRLIEERANSDSEDE